MINRFKKIYFRILLFLDYLIDKLIFKKLLVNKTTKNNFNLKFQINNIITLNRSIFYYEEETLNWIDQFNENEIFWDIGACTGVYSIIASKKKLKSFIFEVDFSTYQICKKNIELNKVDDLCKTFNILIGERTKLINLDINKVAAISKTPIINDRNDNTLMSYKLDDLIYFDGFQAPTYVKIDVERTEDKLFKGGDKFFKQKSIKSIMVEISSDNFEYINKFLNDRGFEIKSKYDQGAGDANYLYHSI